VLGNCCEKPESMEISPRRGCYNELAIRIPLQIGDRWRGSSMEMPDFLTRNQHGEIRLTGHRIGLLHVVDLYNDGAGAEGILCQFPTLSLPLIHKVIAFYLENQAEVDAYVSHTRADIDRLASAPSTGPTMVELRKRLEAMQRTGTS
jgi:uncharacterized protein (DUF433 family)